MVPHTPVRSIAPREIAPQESVKTRQAQQVTIILPPRDIVIAIDAGHGGKDTGAQSRTGTNEKDVVLAVARKLAKLVGREAGMRAVLIRDGDYFVPLRERIVKARAAKADLFISIHADAAYSSDASGSSVYALSQHGATNEASRWLADKENAADLVGGISLDNKDYQLASVLLDMSQTATIDASINLGSKVLSGLRQLGNVHAGHVEQAGFLVLKSPDIPSILVETAYISNPREEKKLRDSGYQALLAEAVMNGVRGYFAKRQPVNFGSPARHSQQYVVRRGETLSQVAEQYQISPETLSNANGNMRGGPIRAGTVLRIPQLVADRDN